MKGKGEKMEKGMGESDVTINLSIKTHGLATLTNGRFLEDLFCLLPLLLTPGEPSRVMFKLGTFSRAF